VPNILEFLSYVFAFQTILSGPLFFYADYARFIRGDIGNEGAKKPLNPWTSAFTKLFLSLTCLGGICAFGSGYNPEVIAEEWALQLSWWRWWALFYWVIFLVRVQYYTVWTLAGREPHFLGLRFIETIDEGINLDSVCNFSGFGFRGYSANGAENWDLVSNVDIWGVEMATSFKETLDNWNKTTMYWLRRVAYDRVPKNYRTISTYLLSAMWHGFSVG